MTHSRRRATLVVLVLACASLAAGVAGAAEPGNGIVEDDYEDVPDDDNGFGIDVSGADVAELESELQFQTEDEEATEIEANPHEARLLEAQEMLVGPPKKRNISAAVQAFYQLSIDLPYLRQSTMKMKLPPGVTRPVPRPPSTPPPGSSRSATSTGTGGGGTTPAFRLPPTEVAGEALFHLATLASSGVVPDHVPFDPLWAVTAQYAAAQAGAIAAKVAVGDRLVHARGGLSPQDCEKGLLYLFSAAKELEAAAEGDREQAVPRESIRLRERERDGALRARLADENAEEQLAMENDLDTRGVAEDARHVGFRRLVGRGVDEDVNAAEAAFHRGVAAGDGWAAYNLGYMAMRGLGSFKAPNHTEAERLFRAAAAKEVPAAFNSLGAMAFHGEGGELDFVAAKALFEEGAARGDPDAHFNLGTLYAGGHGVEADAEAAFASFEAASQAGHWRAPYVLATLHAEGRGTPKNCTQAARLAGLFIEERSDWPGAVDIATADLDAGDPLRALLQLALLAEMGSEVASTNAAWILRKGLSGPKDLSERNRRAADFLKIAAAHGSSEAHVDLGDMHLQGDRLGLPGGANATAAHAHFLRAAELGLSEGTFRLARLYEAGEGVPRNTSVARVLYRRAVDEAYDEAYMAPPLLALALLEAAEVAERWLGFVPWERDLGEGVRWDDVAIVVRSAGDCKLRPPP